MSINRRVRLMTILCLSPAQGADIQAHIDCAPEQEVCGLVGGRWRPYPHRAEAAALAPVPNIDPRPDVRYHMDPEAQVRAMLAWEKQGWEVIGIYHSHPHGPAQPSPSDLAEWAYTDALMLIGHPGGALRAWRIVGREAQVVLIERP